MLFNSRSVTWVALATLLVSIDFVNAIPSFDSSSPALNHRARHQSLHARRDAAVEKRADQLVHLEVKKRDSKKCKARKPGNNTPAANVEVAPAPPSNKPSGSQSSSPKPSGSQSRLDQIKSMYAFEGYVYSLESCQDKDKITSEFKQMVSHKARTVMTFGYCPSKDSVGSYEDVIQAAEDANIKLILLVHTLISGANTHSKVSSRADNIAQAIIKKPNNVLALALGDEPLYDNDFGSPDALAGKINDLKGQFKAAGLSIPISISDMAFGWQSAGQKSSSSSVAKAVDFMMVNTFPYFGKSASWGGNADAFSAFKNDIDFFEGIAAGKPILVTQTGWPSNKAEFAPNSNSIVASVGSSQAYWNLLNSHCSDFFKAKNIGWMWRSWDETIVGWGVKGTNGQMKFNVDGVKTTC